MELDPGDPWKLHPLSTHHIQPCRGFTELGCPGPHLWPSKAAPTYHWHSALAGADHMRLICTAGVGLPGGRCPALSRHAPGVPMGRNSYETLRNEEPRPAYGSLKDSETQRIWSSVFLLLGENPIHIINISEGQRWSMRINEGQRCSTLSHILSWATLMEPKEFPME